MSKRITSFVGLDVHQDSIAVGVAPVGREEPHFMGTVTPQWASLGKALSRLGKPEAVQVVYEAGPCGYTLARQPFVSFGTLARSLIAEPLMRTPSPCVS